MELSVSSRLDHRRHVLSEAGYPLGGRGAAVLRRAGRAGQLPGSGDRSAGQRTDERTGGLAWQLYPAEAVAEDAARRRKAGVPAAVSFATKAEIGLTQLQAQTAQGAPRYCVVADADYGVGTAFRNRLGQLGLPY